MKLVDRQNIFNAGIISTKLNSRDDLKQFNNGVKDALNFVCSRYGPLEKRVGTKFAWELGQVGTPVKLVPFVFSLQQSILLEFLPYAIRFYTFSGDGEIAPIADPDTPSMQYTIVTPFSADQIQAMDYVQSLDVMYLAFGGGQTQPYTLSRHANNDWTLAVFVTEDGPYLDKNYSVSKKMTITDKSTTSSTVTLTGFTLGTPDVGRWIRINTPRYNENTFEYEDKISYGKIASVATGGASITVTWSYRNTVEEEETDWMVKETSEWQLGVWHPSSGNSDYPVTYPEKVCIHQQRLVWSGITNKPWIWTSNSYAYKNYAPSDYEGTISDSNAITLDISTDKVSSVYWMASTKSLVVGTELGEIRVYSAGTAITPSDVVASMETMYGSHNEKPVVTEDMIIFIQRLQRTLRSLTYDYNYDAYVGPELSIVAEHLTAGGIKKVVFQKEPNNTMWVLKEDGELLTLTYDKVQDVIGWSRSKLAGEEVVIKDLVVLPSVINQQDMVLFVIERKVGETTRRYLEVLSKNFIDSIAHKDATFLDCSARITSEEEFDYIEGLDIFEGATLRVMDEGAYVGDYTVQEGRIDMEYPVKDVWLGFAYPAYFETLERDFGDKQVSTKMSRLRVYALYLYMVRTLGVSLNRLQRGSEARLITFDPTKNMDTTPDLVTGRVYIDVPSAWDCEYRLKIISEPGMPCTISGILQGVEINEL